MLKQRPNEPQYAKLWDKETKITNIYGDDIETTACDSALRDKSLRINNDGGIGDNPNRYKQHGFYFNADNCIGCHACESACSEKNDVPSHLAFRSVGFVEGGTYPNYQRLNISMACNHCDDPVCLKGCPTRAYTKFAEYGAVLQDPDICFGCGYCTWVCPYNAPQLDPEKGQVSKCNMCVDRLEVGLKPACVSACLGNALDFGVVENVPDNREQAHISIPGFPAPDITRPNIRFQQTRDTQRDMVRPDGVAIKYHKQADGGFKSTLDDKKHSHQKFWGLKSLLNSHENAHAVFTLLSQAVFGATLWFILVDFFTSTATSNSILTDFFPLKTISNPIFILGILLALMAYGLFKLDMHLGKPQFFYRGFYNLKHSPVSREIAGVSLFFMGLMAIFAAQLFALDFLLNFAYGITILGFIFGTYYMYKLYRIPARPFWNHWQTATAFYGNILSLGSLLFGGLNYILSNQPQAFLPFVMVALLGIILQSLGHIFHKKALKTTGEGQAAYFEQTTTYGKTDQFRNRLLLANIFLLSLLLSVDNMNLTIGILWWKVSFLNNMGLYLYIIATILVVVSSYLSRILFYAVVIPTTMPGAFFWQNDQFKTHAVEVGLSKMPQVGVMAEKHHKFDVSALVDVVKNTSVKAIFTQIKSIIKG